MHHSPFAIGFHSPGSLQIRDGFHILVVSAAYVFHTVRQL
jgi:hypothetical protein